MASRLISSFARCSISRVPFTYGSRFYSTAPLISRTLILGNLISKPCCAISFRSASSTSLASENDKMKRTDKNVLRVLEPWIAEKELKKVLPKDFQFEIIDSGEDKVIILKREYDGEQIQAEVFMDFKHRMVISVTIDKKVGPTLELWCDLTPNNLKISSLTLNPENSNEDYYDLSDLDRSLQRAFQEYLTARGFKKSLYDCLYYRMDEKHFGWKRLKEFIEK